MGPDLRRLRRGGRPAGAARAPHGRGLARRTGWPLAGAFAGNAAWELLSTTGPYPLTPALLAGGIVAPTARAHRELQSLDEAPDVLVVVTGSLLGWTSVATAVNTASALGLRDARRPAHVATAAAALLSTGAALRPVVRRSRRGALPVAATALWGLAGAAAGARSSKVVRLAAMAAAGLVADGFRRRA